MTEWIIWAILGGLLVLFFFLYLLVRRTVTGFKEGIEDSRSR
jgi:hypothetical protein